MGLFDIFKKKKSEEEVAVAPEVAQEVAKTEQEELNTPLRYLSRYRKLRKDVSFQRR